MGDTIQNINGSIIATRGGKAIAQGDITGKCDGNNHSNAYPWGTMIKFETTVMGYIDETTNFDHIEKRELMDLVHQLIDQLKQAPLEKRGDVETIIKASRQLVSSAVQKKPNKSMLRIIASGLKQGAKNMADALPKVLDIVSKLIGIIGKLAI